MVEWWGENGPPVYVAAAAYLGLIKPRKNKSSDQAEVSGNFNELLRLAGPGGMIN